MLIVLQSSGGMHGIHCGSYSNDYFYHLTEPIFLTAVVQALSSEASVVGNTALQRLVNDSPSTFQLLPLALTTEGRSHSRILSSKKNWRRELLSRTTFLGLLLDAPASDILPLCSTFCLVHTVRPRVSSGQNIDLSISIRSGLLTHLQSLSRAFYGIIADPVFRGVL